MKRIPSSQTRHGFFLLEAMLAVAIFALGVLALGKCVNNCLAGVRMQEEEGRARQVLVNRMTEIETGAVWPKEKSTSEDLKGAYQGMKLRTTQVAVVRKNEKKQDIVGIYETTLEVSWESGGQTESRDLIFYASQKRGQGY